MGLQMPRREQIVFDKMDDRSLGDYVQSGPAIINIRMKDRRIVKLKPHQFR